MGFARIALRFEVETDAPQEKLDALLRLTERYCVVLQTLRVPAAFEARMERVG